MAGFRIETRLRPAYVGKAKVLFHCWGQETEVFKECVCTYTVGIVEYGSGMIRAVRPERIKFVPGEFAGYSWGDEEEADDAYCDT